MSADLAARAGRGRQVDGAEAAQVHLQGRHTPRGAKGEYNNKTGEEKGEPSMFGEQTAGCFVRFPAVTLVGVGRLLKCSRFHNKLLVNYVMCITRMGIVGCSMQVRALLYNVGGGRLTACIRYVQYTSVNQECT